MANPIRKAVFRANIDDVLTDIFTRTSTDNVVINKDGKLLSELLSEFATTDYVTASFDSLRDEIRDNVPEAYNSLKKLYEYIQASGGGSGDLTEVWTAINNKADQTTVTEMQSTLQSLSESVSHVCSLYFTQSLPSGLTAGGLWIQPVQDATVLEDLRQ